MQCPLHDSHSRMQVPQDHCRHSPKMYFPVMQHFLMLQVADAPKEAAVKKATKKEKAAKPAGASPKVKRAKNAFMFFSADKRAALKGERYADHTTAVPRNHIAWLPAQRLCIRQEGS